MRTEQWMNSLIIRNSRDLINLRGLDGLVRVEGDVMITANEDLATLDGLNDLEYVGGDLTITFNGRNFNLDLSASCPAAWTSHGPALIKRDPCPWVLKYAAALNKVAYVGGRTTLQSVVTFGTPVPACPCGYYGAR